MQKGLQKLLDSLKLERHDENTFEGIGNVDSGGRIYGGLVLAQAITAAQQTVDDGKHLHSLHSYFLRMGDLETPVSYAVQRIRDGRSYCTRCVEARQHGRAIFSATLSFQLPESGPEHQAVMPDVPGPEGWQPESERIQAFVGDNPYAWPVELRHIDPIDMHNPQPREGKALVWMKAADTLPDDPKLHAAILAYASDNPILIPALYPHGLTAFSPGAMLVTLNHALWLHRPFRIDDWLLFEADSDVSGGGRGMGRGKIFNRQGELVASAVQEGVLRYQEQ